MFGSWKSTPATMAPLKYSLGACNYLIMFKFRQKRHSSLLMAKTLPNEAVKTEGIFERGQEAQQKLREISVIDNQIEFRENINCWAKYNEGSSKQVGQQKGSFDATLTQLRRNSTIVQKTQIYLRNKKYSRDQEFKKSLKNSMKSSNTVKEVKNNCASVNIRLNDASSKKERIHSHSVRLDTSFQFKIAPNSHFVSMSSIFKGVESAKKQKPAKTTSKFSFARKEGEKETPAVGTPKKSSIISVECKRKVEDLPESLFHLKKFINILNNMKFYERQGSVLSQTTHLSPPKMRGTLRKARLSTFS